MPLQKFHLLGMNSKVGIFKHRKSLQRSDVFFLFLNGTSAEKQKSADSE